MTEQQVTQTVKQAGVKPKPHRQPVVAAGGGSVGMVVAGYLGTKYDLDPEMVMILTTAVGVLTTLAVHYLHNNFPVLLNALESATGRDLDRDGDVGQ